MNCPLTWHCKLLRFSWIPGKWSLLWFSILLSTGPDVSRHAINVALGCVNMTLIQQAGFVVPCVTWQQKAKVEVCSTPENNQNLHYWTKGLLRSLGYPVSNKTLDLSALSSRLKRCKGICLKRSSILLIINPSIYITKSLSVHYHTIVCGCLLYARSTIAITFQKYFI